MTMWLMNMNAICIFTQMQLFISIYRLFYPDEMETVTVSLLPSHHASVSSSLPLLFWRPYQQNPVMETRWANTRQVWDWNINYLHEMVHFTKHEWELKMKKKTSLSLPGRLWCFTFVWLIPFLFLNVWVLNAIRVKNVTWMKLFVVVCLQPKTLPIDSLSNDVVRFLVETRVCKRNRSSPRKSHKF